MRNGATGNLTKVVMSLARTKYNVDKDVAKRTHDGITFDSVMEMKYYRDVLCPKKESGEILEIELQKVFELQPKFVHDGKTVRAITYVADFYVVYSDGHESVIETKGYADQKAPIKRKMFWYRYPDVDYRWICYSKIDGGWCDYDFVKKQRSLRKKQRKEALIENV